MKIAILHDWLVTYAGAEKVLENIISLYPDADLFSIVDFLPPDERGFILQKEVKTSFIQKLPFARTKYRHYIPLMPLAVEQFDMSGYDLVISSSHAVAKGVLTRFDQLHISYIHSPIRYAWDMQHLYLKEAGLDKGVKGWFVKWLLHRIRLWDLGTANGVDFFIANSQFICGRIKKIYRRDAAVIYPPVDVAQFSFCADKDDYYLTASRMVPYKRMGLIVDAFSAMKTKRLVVIGDGPDFKKIKSRAGKNIELMGYQPADVLAGYMQKAKAFVFAAEEDFGIIPVEAQACGTPVIAYGKGGVRETVLPDKTGVFFDEQSVESVIGAVDEFEKAQGKFDYAAIRRNAERFSSKRFKKEFKEVVEAEVLKCFPMSR